MEQIKLTVADEINQFHTFLNENPDVVLSKDEVNGIIRYHLTTDQIIEIPDSKYSNKLVFGKDQTLDIVNVSYKDHKLYRYYKNGTADVIDYKPWVLTSSSTKTGYKLKGNQYYNYITHVDDTKYKELVGQWNKDVFIPRSIEEGYMMLNGVTYYKNLKFSDISYLSFDIENLDDKRFNHRELVVLISNTFRDSKGVIARKLFSIKNYTNSVEMVKAWCDWVREIDPDVMLGHNIFSHDLRILNLVTPLKLGKDKSDLYFETKTSKFRKDAQQQYEYFNAHVQGREIVDTFFLAIKYDVVEKKFPSYGLKAIEKFLKLVDENRIEWDFTENPVEKVLTDDKLWDRFTQYSINDADGPLKMTDIMLPSYFYFAQTIPQPMQMVVNNNTGGQINSFLIRSYLQDGYSIPKTTQITEKIPGGISFAIPGVYRNLFKVDLKSCYPSQVLRFKLYDKKKDPNQHYYKMVKYFTEERFELKRLYQETKDKYYKDRDAVAKIFINSAYGLTITNYLNFNSPEIGKKITAESREIIDKSLIWASGKGKDYWMRLFKEKTGQAEEEQDEFA